MKSTLPALFVSLLLVSCSTAYKSGQTPDDVYFSPAPTAAQGDEYVQAERPNGNGYRDNNTTGYVSGYNMAPLTDWHYSYNPYYYQMWNNTLLYSNPYYNPFYANYWGSYSYGCYYYNPYYSHVVVFNPPTPVHHGPRVFNLNAYNQQPDYPHGVTRTFGNIGQSNSNRSNPNNYRGSGSNAGSFLRNVFNGSGSNSGTPSRSYSNNSPGSNSSYSPGASRSSGGGGGSAPARRF